ncbi:hypothetical protein [Aliterella atlantica]|uniref:hypothetical protein n=1 Tax=Aliterella atlantica TaxID=1827278 RepID=UPI0011858A7B|nr:hypothetical protein [Aliterella atlantica]
MAENTGIYRHLVGKITVERSPNETGGVFVDSGDRCHINADKEDLYNMEEVRSHFLVQKY